jgi:uncharacterized protein YyaL (SSP411 family)
MQHTNKLINASSPYLLQHAHNPVNWNPWCDEILQKSIDEDKPILVSIGYSSCHWCHVMEKESFEDEATAEIMNNYFINIKIDREERPDLDHIYMDALQAMTGSGGWPLNVFLTPQLKPFYGGTYFPPKPYHGRMSWIDTLEAVNNAFKNRRDEIESQASKLTNHLISSNSFGKINSSDESIIDKETLEMIADNILKNADSEWGGFGKAPKFPQTSSIQYLLRQYHFTKNEIYLNQALLSLDKMTLGGIYDQIGGGYARYSTDEKWFAPHFEKMLYDNALLVAVLSEAYQITKNQLYADTIAKTLEFIEREMMSEKFAFYSALDADSEGIEGKYYTWSKLEIEELLGEEDAEIFCEIYNITSNGNWEHNNILWLDDTIENLASEKNIEYSVLRNKLEICRNVLLQKRASRIKPQLDNKTLTSWNSLMNIAYCKAYAATGYHHYKDVAIKNMQFVLDNMFFEEELMHCYNNNTAYNSAFIEDYSYLIWALIHLQEITGEPAYLLKAKQLCDDVLNKFADTESPFFYFTESKKNDIIVRKIEIYDGAMPSANSVMALCLNYLSQVFFDDNLRKRFLDMIHKLKPAITQHPTSFSTWAILLQNVVNFPKQIVVVGIDSSAAISGILSSYLPNKILVTSTVMMSDKIPLLIGKGNVAETYYYLCENQTCLPPEKELSKFLHSYNI